MSALNTAHDQHGAYFAPLTTHTRSAWRGRTTTAVTACVTGQQTSATMRAQYGADA
jgi:hypothetical protein